MSILWRDNLDFKKNRFCNERVLLLPLCVNKVNTESMIKLRKNYSQHVVGFNFDFHVLCRLNKFSSTHIIVTFFKWWEWIWKYYFFVSYAKRKGEWIIWNREKLDFTVSQIFQLRCQLWWVVYKRKVWKFRRYAYEKQLFYNYFLM